MAIPTGSGDYFTATFLLRTTIHFDEHLLIPFENTRMGRSLMCVDVSFLKLYIVKLPSIHFIPAICRSKIDYDCQIYSTAFLGRLKSVNSIHRESIKI